MEQRLSWRPNSSSTGQQSFLTLRNPEIHHRVLNPLSLARPILSKSFHILFLEDLFNIIIVFMLRTFKWLIFFRFTHQNSLCMSLLFQRCHKYRPSNTPWHNHLNNIWWKVCHDAPHYVLFPASVFFLPLMLKCPPQRLILEYSQPILFPCYERPRFTPIKYHRKNCFFCMFSSTRLIIALLNKCRMSEKYFLHGLGCWGQCFWRNKKERTSEMIVPWGINHIYSLPNLIRMIKSGKWDERSMEHA